MQGKWLADLNYLIQDADLGLSNLADASLLALIMTKDGDVVDYDGTTDSLQALAEAIAGIAAGTGTPNAFLAAVGGLLNDVAATGAVSDAKTAVSYLKQIVTMLLEGTYGLSNLQVLIAAIQTDLDNGTDGLGALKALIDLLQVDTTAIITDLDNATDGLGALKTLIDAIPTTAMRGTESALTAAVGGALDTTAHTGLPDDATTMMGYEKQIVADTETLSMHTLLYGGATAYADASAADDTGAGTTPRTAKKTIAAAQVVAGIGGAVNVTAGTYVEDVVMSYANQEMHFEIGAILDGTGTCLTVSGGNCKVVGPVKITPAADQIGVLVETLDGNQFTGVRVKGSAAATGWKFEVGGSICRECSGAGIKAGGACFDIQGNGTKLHRCYAAGTTTSYGYFVDGTITRGFLSGCISVGNQTSGFYLDGVAARTVVDCSSGAGDGAAVDVDNANTWCNFCFDDCVVKSNVLSVAGGGGTSTYNLYQLTGAVKVVGIFADVETALTGTNTDCFLQLSSENGDVEISKDDSGVTLGALGVGSVVMRLDKEDKVLVVGDVTLGPALIDQTDVKEEGFRIIQDRKAGADVDTYIQFVHTCADTGTGTLHWHCKWEPVGEGFLKAA